MPRLQGRITGIVLGGYKHNVYEFLKHDVGTVDKGMFMEALESAVCHLHDMRFAYNDITPLNIMVGEDRLPVLVGFGSCRMLAEAMSASRGTGGLGGRGRRRCRLVGAA